MKTGSFPSYFGVALLLFLGFFSVHSLDQVLQYQDPHPLKDKLPLERLGEFHPHVRHRRDTDPLKNATVDDHKYYKTIYMENAASDWFELSDHPEKMVELYLSNGYLKSKNFKLKFTFPYYGHPITNATVTTGGFLYVGYVRTSLITKVMYIAPFMAPFDPSLNKSAEIYYFSNATQFTVQWNNLHLSKKQNESSGPFTFQVSLYKDGRIRFAYKMIPLTPWEVSHLKPVAGHPVTVGISDAFFGYRMYYDNRRWRTIRVFYVYHKVNKTMNITSGSSLLLLPVKTCITAKSCGGCMNLTKVSQFKCSWCSKLKRCSDSFDRHRVEWIQKSCYQTAIKEYKNCSLADGNSSRGKKTVYSRSSQRSSGISAGSVAAIIVCCIVLIIIIAVGAWCFFAYTHPVSSSGLFLIELRNKPAQLFKRNESGTTTVDGATSKASRA